MSEVLVIAGGILFLVCLIERLHKLALSIALIVLVALLLPHALARPAKPVSLVLVSDTKKRADFETGFTVICARQIRGRSATPTTD